MDLDHGVVTFKEAPLPPASGASMGLYNPSAIVFDVFDLIGFGQTSPAVHETGVAQNFKMRQNKTKQHIHLFSIHKILFCASLC